MSDTPRHDPEQLTQIGHFAFQNAQENMIRLAGVSHEEAARMVMGVLSPLMILPPGGDLPYTTDGCQWAYLKLSGEMVICEYSDDPPAMIPHSLLDGPGLHSSDDASFTFHEEDPRAFQVTTWRPRETEEEEMWES